MPLEDDYAVHLFTDGSAAFPTKPTIRLSSWAVVQADLKADEFQLVALGGVPGFIQTSPRAELTAVISAFLYGVKFCNLFYIWTDCQLVVDGIRDFASHGPPSAATADHDLWDRLWNLWKQATQAGQLGKIIKLRSHQEPSVYSDVIERWAIRGNDAADHWAERARTALPSPLREAHAQAVRDFRLQSAAQEKVHSTLCAVGMHSVETKQARRQSDDQVLEEVDREADPQAQVSFCPLPSSCPDGGSALGANAELLFRWVLRLSQAADCQRRWVTSYELLTHYQATTGHVGFWYNTDTRSFEDATPFYQIRDFDFCKLANWFQSALKELASILGTSYIPVSRLPHASYFRCWTRCLLVGINPTEHRAVGTWLHPDHKGGRIQSVRRAFGNLPALTELRL
eukprot:Skav202876  [mRNA]  locus=scaffold3541:201846:203042:- [translate_table: standard]